MVEQVVFSSNDIKVHPDFIYNRIDLFSNNCILLHVHNELSDYMIEVQLFERHAELGIWMMSVTGVEFDEISDFIFKTYDGIEYVSFYFAISDRVYIANKHYHVNLPATYDELKGRLSAKSRNTMSRKRKKIESEYGSIRFVDYENDSITDEIVASYFDMKERLNHICYNMTCRDYLAKYHVSNIYIMYAGEKIAAMILTCEQCSIAYLENLTYDSDFSKCSPGLLAYEMVLERLILKGKTAFYLGGGDYDYKKKYDSVETIVTEGKIYRSWTVEIKYKWIDFYNKHLYWKIKSIRKRLFP